MTEDELRTANEYLSEGYLFVPEIGFEVADEDFVLSMADLLDFFTYLNLINVDPYAD